jgi:protein TonB
MTSHEKSKQKLEAFADNELSEQERKTIAEHLAQCSACRDEVALIKKLHLLAKEIVPKPSADYAENLSHQVWQKIRAKESERIRGKGRFFSIPRLAPILAGAAVVLLVAIGIKLLTPIPEAKKPRALFRMRGIVPMAGAARDQVQPETEKAELGKKGIQPLGEKTVAKEMKSDEFEAREVKKVETTGAATNEEIASLPPEVTESATKGTTTGKTEEIEALAAGTQKESAQMEREVLAGEDKGGGGLAGSPSKVSEIRAEGNIANKPTQTGMLMAQPPKESTKIESIITAADLEKRAEPIEKLKVKGYFIVGVEPEPIEIAKPKYPKSPQDKKLEGEAVIKVIVGLKGQVEYAEILKSSGYGILDTAALKAAKKSKFKPVVEKGKKVRAWTTIPFRFPPQEK